MYQCRGVRSAPPEIVEDTLPPRKMAPHVSMTTAMAMAHFSFSVREPTDVANAFATSAQYVQHIAEATSDTDVNRA